MEQATTLDQNHVQHIRALLSANPEWRRSHLSVELCKVWGWQSPAGQYKNMACRSLLLKLERAGAIVLPPASGNALFIRVQLIPPFLTGKKRSATISRDWFLSRSPL